MDAVGSTLKVILAQLPEGEGFLALGNARDRRAGVGVSWIVIRYANLNPLKVCHFVVAIFAGRGKLGASVR